MGVRIHKLELVVDHAAPEKPHTVRLHLDLPLAPQDIKSVRQLLEAGAWGQLQACLAARYPQHANLLEDGLEACALRATKKAAHAPATV